MLRSDKERVVERLAERLRTTDTLMVADYRGLSMPEIDELRTRLLEAGARFTVVKNTLTKLAAEAAGAKDVLELIEGPTAIAFLEAESDPAAVAKVLNEVARATDVLVIRGGVLEGTLVGDAEIKRLATLPPVDVLKAQLVGAIAAPLTTVVGLFAAPLRDLVGVIDARIRQLEGQGETVEEPQAEAAEEPAAEEAPADQPQAEAEEVPAEEPQAEEPTADEAPAEEPQAEAAEPPTDEEPQEATEQEPEEEK